MEFVIRPPHVDESEVLADRHLRTWAETYSEIFPSSAWDEEARAGRIRQWTALCTDPQPAWRTAVAEAGGRPVGIAHVEGDAENRVLSFIYVLVEAHGSGAGQALLDAVLGTDSASLWVLEQNTRARAFYSRNRFVETGERHTGLGGHEIRLLR